MDFRENNKMLQTGIWAFESQNANRLLWDKKIGVSWTLLFEDKTGLEFKAASFLAYRFEHLSN